MIISNRQIMQLIKQLKDHHDMLVRLNFGNLDYMHYLNELYDEIVNQQSEELKVIE